MEGGSVTGKSLMGAVRKALAYYAKEKEKGKSKRPKPKIGMSVTMKGFKKRAKIMDLDLKVPGIGVLLDQKLNGFYWWNWGKLVKAK